MSHPPKYTEIPFIPITATNISNKSSFLPSSFIPSSLFPTSSFPNPTTEKNPIKSISNLNINDNTQTNNDTNDHTNNRSNNTKNKNNDINNPGNNLNTNNFSNPHYNYSTNQNPPIVSNNPNTIQLFANPQNNNTYNLNDYENFSNPTNNISSNPSNYNRNIFLNLNNPNNPNNPNNNPNSPTNNNPNSPTNPITPNSTINTNNEHNNNATDDVTDLNAKVWSYSYQMLLTQSFCDVTIVSQQGYVKAHSTILAYHSPYLKQAFEELKCDVTVIKLETVPLDTVRQLVFFLYTGELRVNKFNLVDLLNVSEQYSLPSLQQQCLCFFKKVTTENAIFLLSLTTSMKLQNMHKCLLSFIAQSFLAVSNTLDFVHIPYDFLVTILLSPELNIPSEINAFNAVLKWISHDKECRLHHAHHLLSGPIRLELISVDELSDEVEREDWLFASPQCKQALSEAYRKKLLMTHGLCKLEGRNNTLSSPSTPPFN